MRLKILLLPFFIVVTLVLIIGYIKPDLDTVWEKRAEIGDKSDKLVNVKTVLENINSLNDSLDTDQKPEQFVYQYLPKNLNQEQVIDAFNFLALQSGLTISKMELKQPQEIKAEEPLINGPARSFVAGGRSSDNSGSSVLAVPATAKIFLFKGGVTGQYASIKSFFERLSRIERFQKIHSFAIEVPEKTASGQPPVAADSLNGTFEAEYGYLPFVSGVSALDVPIFMQSKFDFSNANALLGSIANPLPPLGTGTAGKPNPFQ